MLSYSSLRTKRDARDEQFGIWSKSYVIFFFLSFFHGFEKDVAVLLFSVNINVNTRVNNGKHIYHLRNFEKKCELCERNVQSLIKLHNSRISMVKNNRNSRS